jgi:hypothetical protein
MVQKVISISKNGSNSDTKTYFQGVLGDFPPNKRASEGGDVSDAYLADDRGTLSNTSD